MTTGDRQPTTRIAAILLLFLAPRIALLFVRQPFFDELFTRWISAKSLGGILDALHYDSGPPLYYWLLRLLGNPPLPVARGLSLLFATVGIAAILMAKRLGETRFAAASLIAVFPPAVLYSVDARAYALCGMFVTLGVIALAYERPYLAAGALLFAAYSHYYGALFLVLLVPQVRALAAAIVLYLPALWLAFHQPREAIGWMSRWAYPDALFVRPPLLLAIAVAVLLIAAMKPMRQALWTLVPLALAIALNVYVPLRFEAVAAALLMLWLAASGRRVVLIPLGVAFALWTALGIADHVLRPPDDFHAAAAWLARNVAADQPVVASGYLYLETVAHRPAIPFPPEQAQHPGWRAVARTGSGLPSGAFLWIGERAAPELDLIRRARSVTPVYMNERAIVVRVN
jgi:hypothetical protein